MTSIACAATIRLPVTFNPVMPLLAVLLAMVIALEPMLPSVALPVVGTAVSAAVVSTRLPPENAPDDP